MAPGIIQGELERVSRRINAWQAELKGVFWVAIVLATLWVLSISDLLLRYPRAGRLAVCALLFGVVAAACAHVLVVLRRRRTTEATAALLEHAFPQLDNHLINYVQFAAQPSASVLESAYLQRGVPEWSGLNLRALRDWRRYRGAYLVCAVAVLLMIAPYSWIGDAWVRAVIRVINPYAPIQPQTLAVLIGVQPGHATVTQGDELVITSKVQGRKGQAVRLELWPRDDKSSVVALGQMAGNGVESFAYRLPKVTADLAYRVRAGDAPASEKFQVKVVAPLAFAALGVKVLPPPYTRLPAVEFDGLVGIPLVPRGAKVELRLKCNHPLASATAGLDQTAPIALASVDNGQTWAGALNVASGKVLRVAAVGRDGTQVKTEVNLQLIPDKAPAIRIIAPLGKTVLAPGALPAIQFDVTDDYGLSRVVLQRVAREEKTPAEGAGETVREWGAPTGKVVAASWVGKPEDLVPNTALRLVAVDNLAPGEPNRSVSPSIDFERTSAESLAQERQKNIGDAAVTLGKLLELQRANLNLTLKLDGDLTNSTPQQWGQVLDAQKLIREIAGKLLADPRKPLAALTDLLDRAYQGPMLTVLDVLDRVSKAAEPAAKGALTQQAIQLENAILRMLSQSEAGVGKAQESQTISGLLAMIDALVKSQTDALADTRDVLKNKPAPAPALAQRQDLLANELADFLQFCQSETKKIEISEPDFAKIVLQAVAVAEERKIRTAMLSAAERLEGGQIAEAVPAQTQALDGLKEVQALLNKWRTQNAAAKAADMLETIQASKEIMEKLIDVQSNAIAGIRAVENQKDMSKKEYDELGEELDELKAEMAESVLKLAKDLQALPDLPVGNDLVEDVSSIYEEMKQIEGSDKTPAQELGLQKEDFILDLMKQAAKRMDDMELWLHPEPDFVKRNTENFDKQEMPQITVAEMPTHLEDIISDLLKQQEDIKKKADDSLTNQGSSDMPAGWDTMEGEYANFSGKGKSANTEPNHKDQDGRSLVGRQGMSDGETVAGSGKINKGDDNLDKRITRDKSQSGQVQEDGHSKAKATGGGKSSGYGDEKGMAGQGPRRDSTVNKPSELGQQVLLRRNAEAVFAQANLQHLRTGQLNKAIKHMRQAEDALVKGLPIQEVSEFQRRAVAALKATQVELSSGFTKQSVQNAAATARLDDQFASTADEAPTQYRDLVAEYFKTLGQHK
jgi:hypothetical protein